MKKIIIILIVVAVVAIILYATGIFNKLSTGYQWCYEWIKQHVPDGTITPPNGATAYTQCMSDAEASGVTVTDENFLAAWNQRMTELGFAPTSINDRRGLNGPAIPAPKYISDRNGLDEPPIANPTHISNR